MLDCTMLWEPFTVWLFWIQANCLNLLVLCFYVELNRCGALCLKILMVCFQLHIISFITHNIEGVGSGSDVMFVRILSILQTLTGSAPNEHKHSIRQNMAPPASQQPSTTETTPSPSSSSSASSSTNPAEPSTAPVVAQDLLRSVVSFLGTCSRRKNSPLLRDALRSVVGIMNCTM